MSAPNQVIEGECNWQPAANGFDVSRYGQVAFYSASTPSIWVVRDQERVELRLPLAQNEQIAGVRWSPDGFTLAVLTRDLENLSLGKVYLLAQDNTSFVVTSLISVRGSSSLAWYSDQIVIATDENDVIRTINLDRNVVAPLSMVADENVLIAVFDFVQPR
ncbi:MAG: hypothetical protein IPO91_28910 [Chloroflexi bacterium]|nr:hypothetical protein [Chloroflexota bacterium]